MGLLNSLSSALGMTTNHNKYYYPDGNVIYQVENTLFKIHRFLILQSTLEMEPVKITMKSKGHFKVPSISRDTTNPIFLADVPAKSFEALLDVLYLPGLADPEIITSNVLMAAMDVSERFSLNDVSHRITTTLQSRTHNSSLHTSFAMFICCIRHPQCFPRSFVIQQFTDICTNTERIDTINLTGLDSLMTVNIMQGRELVREGHVAQNNRAREKSVYGAGPWEEPQGWSGFLESTFPPTDQDEDGWELGPKPGPQSA